MIISSKLDIKQGEQLLEVLRRSEDAIGWTLMDLKEMDPLVCTHHIFLEDESRPIKEAVKEEILKWLNAEILYLISDSQWVSPLFQRKLE